MTQEEHILGGEAQVTAAQTKQHEEEQYVGIRKEKIIKLGRKAKI